MKKYTNQNQHSDLPEKDLRDFFSLMVAKYSMCSGKDNRESLIGLHGYDYALKSNELDLIYLTEENKRLKIMFSITTLLKERGWEEWDTSDELGPHTDGKYYGFIGTEEEYNNFITKIKNDV